MGRAGTTFCGADRSSGKARLRLPRVMRCPTPSGSTAISLAATMPTSRSLTTLASSRGLPRISMSSGSGPVSKVME